ncbi:MAG: hypothetical protein U0941_30105 [Planctomycetaceae bacterium]
MKLRAALKILKFAGRVKYRPKTLRAAQKRARFQDVRKQYKDTLRKWLRCANGSKDVDKAADFYRNNRQAMGEPAMFFGRVPVVVTDGIDYGLGAGYGLDLYTQTRVGSFVINLAQWQQKLVLEMCRSLVVPADIVTAGLDVQNGGVTMRLSFSGFSGEK